MRSIGYSGLVFALAFGLAPLGCAVSAGLAQREMHV
jgi:hypothetical protein